jgi:hypothetical protein
MTLAEFRTEGLRLCNQAGQAYVTANGDLNKLINETLREYTRRTLCLFSDRLAFLPTSGVATYRFDTGIAAFSTVPIIDIVRVYMTQNGSFGPLRDFHYRPGLVVLSDLADRFPEYLTTPSGVTAHAFKTLPKTLVLWPAPLVVSGTHYVSGFQYHPVLAADGDNIVLPDEDERAALQFFAHLLMLPNATGESREAVETNLALAREGMDRAGEEARALVQTSTTRQSEGVSTFSLTDF